MRKWWIGYTGKDGKVEEVEVIGQRNPEASWGMSVVRLATGTIDDVRTSDLHETETAARRGRAMGEAEDLEDEARNLEESADHERKAAQWRLSVAAGRDEDARALRARAKVLRDVPEEVKDAVEGRR